MRVQVNSAQDQNFPPRTDWKVETYQQEVVRPQDRCASITEQSFELKFLEFIILDNAFPTPLFLLTVRTG